MYGYFRERSNRWAFYIALAPLVNAIKFAVTLMAPTAIPFLSYPNLCFQGVFVGFEFFYDYILQTKRFNEEIRVSILGSPDVV